MSEQPKTVPGKYVVIVLVGAAIIMGLFALWYRDLSILRPTTLPTTATTF